MAAGIRRVVVGATDPNPKHRGKAFKILKRAGIAVTRLGAAPFGVARSRGKDEARHPDCLKTELQTKLASDCARLNEAFNHWIVHRTPFVTVTQVTMVPGSATSSVIASKDVYSSRYFDASLTLTIGSGSTSPVSTGGTTQTFSTTPPSGVGAPSGFTGGTSSAPAASLGLRAKQRAFDAYHALLVAYNRQYRPPHEAERPLSTPARLAAWCRTVRDLFRRAAPADCPVHALEKAFRRPQALTGAGQIKRIRNKFIPIGTIAM